MLGSVYLRIYRAVIYPGCPAAIPQLAVTITRFIFGYSEEGAGSQRIQASGDTDMSKFSLVYSISATPGGDEKCNFIQGIAA